MFKNFDDFAKECYPYLNQAIVDNQYKNKILKSLHLTWQSADEKTFEAFESYCKEKCADVLDDFKKTNTEPVYYAERKTQRHWWCWANSVDSKNSTSCTIE